MLVIDFQSGINMTEQENQFLSYLEDADNLDKLQDIVPDEKLEEAFSGTTYDPEEYRNHLKYALLKRACGLYICGSLHNILVFLGLSYKNKNLTAIGNSYLWNAFKSEEYE